MTAPLIQPEPERDRWGRYRLPRPDAPGKAMVSWTRATTFAKSIADTYGLGKWQTRMAVKGMTLRPDLLALAASTDDSSTLDRVCEDAKEAAGSSSGANAGTALHTFTERVDRGEEVRVPHPWDADVAAYSSALAAAGLTVDPRFIERIVVVPELGVAGTYDRVLRAADGRLVVGDLKTGKDLSHSWADIAVQLALYANATAMWNGITGEYEPMPPVDKRTAVVIHLPARKGAAHLYELDIEAGWQAARLCYQVREWRSRKNLAKPYLPPLPRIAPPARAGSVAELSDADVAAWEASNIMAAISEAGSRVELERLWAANADRWTPAMTDAAARRVRQLDHQSRAA